MIGWGRLRAWTALIRPFWDRLDITIPFIFYAVPDTNPDGPPTVFTDRFWDDRDHFYPDGVGVVPGSQKPYFGPVPPVTVGPLVGDLNSWIAGVSYADWTGGLIGSSPCWPLGPQPGPLRLRQKQRVRTVYPPQVRGLQKQAITLGSGASLRQKQTGTGLGVFTCANAVGGSPQFFRFTIVGATGGCAVLNGTWVVSNVGGSCTWSSPAGLVVWTLQVQPAGATLTGTVAGVIQAVYSAPSFDCLASVYPLVLSMNFCGGLLPSPLNIFGFG